MTRRRLLTSLGAGGTGLALGAGGYVLSREREPDAKAVEAPTAQQPIAFFGHNQAGIATAAQDRLHFAAFDVITERRSELRDMLRAWTRAAARMCDGDSAAPDRGDALAPPADTGEAMGLPAARLTITFGFGPSLFGRPGSGDRFGLAVVRPPELDDLPRLPGGAQRRAAGLAPPDGQLGAEFDQVDLAATTARGPPGDPGGRPHPAGEPAGQQRRHAAAPRLLLHRRHGRAGPARRRAVLHLLPARPAPPVRGGPAPPGRPGRPERIHQAHGQRGVRRPSGRETGGYVGKKLLG